MYTGCNAKDDEQEKREQMICVDSSDNQVTSNSAEVLKYDKNK